LRKFTIMIIPDGIKSTKQFRVHKSVGTLVVLLGLIFCGFAGYFITDYIQLRGMRTTFTTVSAENQGLKGEARQLLDNLENVKKSLRNVDSFSNKLSELIQVRVQKVSKKTGIGPLSSQEFDKASRPAEVFESHIPEGLSIDSLVFKPVFKGLASLGNQANNQALELRQLLASIGQQKSLLTSIPALAPVNGWVTSGFGNRISPFTGQKTSHRGIDIAAPEGAPIYAPADGIVIFTGAKSGFGNFIMIAHGYGIVSRYGHNHQNMVTIGQKVSRGDQIATVGMTGRTTGPHLHYEVWLNGRAENPNNFILNLDDYHVY